MSLLLVSLGLIIYIPLLFFIEIESGDLLCTFFLLLAFQITVKQKIAINKLEKGYITKILTEIEDYKKVNKNSILEFNDTYIRWENHKMDLRFNWEALAKIRLVNNILFFDISNNLPFIILSKDEIKDENYHLLIDLLNHKKLI